MWPRFIRNRAASEIVSVVTGGASWRARSNVSSTLPSFSRSALISITCYPAPASLSLKKSVHQTRNSSIHEYMRDICERGSSSRLVNITAMDEEKSISRLPKKATSSICLSLKWANGSAAANTSNAVRCCKKVTAPLPPLLPTQLAKCSCSYLEDPLVGKMHLPIMKMQVLQSLSSSVSYNQ